MKIFYLHRSWLKLAFETVECASFSERLRQSIASDLFVTARLCHGRASTEANSQTCFAHCRFPACVGAILQWRLVRNDNASRSSGLAQM